MSASAPLEPNAPARTLLRTGKVEGRRELHFTTIDQVLDDSESLIAAWRSGHLRMLGNWSLGQNFGHLAGWVRYSFEGVPLKIPGFMRLLLRPMKHRMLYKPMRPGSNIPRVPGGTLATDPLDSEEGFEQMRTWFGRLNSESPAIPHLLFGQLTHDEWKNMHLRHAELHLSFARPG